MALHGDLLNSLGVIVAVVLIHFTGWEIIDQSLVSLFHLSYLMVAIRL